MTGEKYCQRAQTYLEHGGTLLDDRDLAVRLAKYCPGKTRPDVSTGCIGGDLHSMGVVKPAVPSSRAPTTGTKYFGSNTPTRSSLSDAISRSAASCATFPTDTTGCVRSRDAHEGEGTLLTTRSALPESLYVVLSGR